MFSIHLCAEAACAEDQRRTACASAMRSNKIKIRRGPGAGGPGPAGRGQVPPPLPLSREPSRPPVTAPPSEPSELSEAVARTGVLFRKMKNTTFR
jgi:hypothetical protein